MEMSRKELYLKWRVHEMCWFWRFSGSVQNLFVRSDRPFLVNAVRVFPLQLNLLVTGVLMRLGGMGGLHPLGRLDSADRA